MPEVIVIHILGVDVVDADVHVQASLDVVDGDVLVLEIFGRLPHRMRQSWIFGGYPAPLDLSPLFLVPYLLLVLAHQSGDIPD